MMPMRLIVGSRLASPLLLILSGELAIAIATRMKVTPGDRLGDVLEQQAGSGAYADEDGTIRADRAGERAGSAVEEVVSVSGKGRPPVPIVGTEILGRVTRIGQRGATVEIVAVGQEPLGEAFPGLVRQQDMRAVDPEKAEVGRSFRTGDAVRARVLSAGLDARAFFLGTREGRLGVLFARSQCHSEPMLPASWASMRCSSCGALESRKVAGPE